MPIHVQQRPKKRTRANPGQHRFLDLQAVEDDEDSEEEGGGWDNLVGKNEAFVVDDHDLIEDTGGHTRRNLEIEVLKRGNSLRHVIEKWSDVNIKKPKSFKYYEFSLPPNTDHDWELWEVPVNVGSEAAVVFEIMHRVLRLIELTKTGKLHLCTKPPRSTFAPLSSARELKEGDKVKVVGSTYADSIGIIKELTPTYAYLLLLDSLASAQIPRLFLRRYYKIGDRVTIKAGVDAGLTGYIIAVNDKDDTVVICNPLVTMTQVVTPIYYVEFAADGLRFGKPPPRGPFTIAKLVDMRDPTFAHLENLHIVVTKGPLKGQSGVVKSVAITGITSIEMNVLSTQVNQLQRVKVQNLVFEL
ncbi:hypothetical protein AN958_06409 [Leucoagaricus sp. SymC.cos]|nr:hypothetical protein AN958_06409 [Leucoagaricus sp. SymC.cos]